MRRKYRFIGLDTANVCGVAILEEGDFKRVEVIELTGPPVEQFRWMVEDILERNGYHEDIFVIEGLHNSRNLRVVKSISERNGYFKHSLLGLGYQVVEVPPSVARAWLGSKTKVGTHNFFLPHIQNGDFTSNHADALAVALYQAGQLLDITKDDLSELHIEIRKGEKFK